MEPAHDFGGRAEKVRIAWVDERRQVKCVAGRCIDVSSKRIHVEVREQIPVHTRVLLRADGLKIAGSASVKYVTRCEATFILVLDVRDDPREPAMLSQAQIGYKEERPS
jgi:hypothetical protein